MANSKLVAGVIVLIVLVAAAGLYVAKQRAPSTAPAGQKGGGSRGEALSPCTAGWARPGTVIGDVMGNVYVVVSVSGNTARIGEASYINIMYEMSATGSVAEPRLNDTVLRQIFSDPQKVLRIKKYFKFKNVSVTEGLDILLPRISDTQACLEKASQVSSFGLVQITAKFTYAGKKVPPKSLGTPPGWHYSSTPVDTYKATVRDPETGTNATVYIYIDRGLGILVAMQVEKGGVSSSATYVAGVYQMPSDALRALAGP